MNNTQTLAERLESALRDGGWKPIESAPKIDCNNGCVLRLGLIDNDDPVVMFWWENQDGWFEFRGKQVFPYMWQNIPTVPGEPDPLLTLIRELMEVMRRQDRLSNCLMSHISCKGCISHFKEIRAETAPLLAVMEEVK